MSLALGTVLVLIAVLEYVGWDIRGEQDELRDYRPGGRMEVPWARVAVTLLSTWVVAIEPDPGSWGHEMVLHARMPDSAAACWLWVDNGESLVGIPELGEALGAELASETLTLASQPARWTGWTLLSDDGSWFHSEYDVVSPDGWEYELDCSAPIEQQRPVDRWLSIAESLECPP